jgi:hypothetical protein
VCNFALRLARLVEQRDVAGVIAAARASPVVCPDMASEYRPPVCADVPEGVTRQGFGVAYLQSEGGAVSESALASMLAGWFNEASPALSDEFGGGGWQLATVGCGVVRRGNVDTVSCDVRFAIVFTAISDRARVLMEFVVEQEPTPAIELFVHGIASINQEFVYGGHNVLPLRFDFEDRNGTDFFPVRLGPQWRGVVN